MRHSLKVIGFAIASLSHVAGQECACTDFATGASLGSISNLALDEASGLAASRRNLGVLWSHNDGSQGRTIYAMTLAGAHLAVFNLGQSVDDVEDIAVGPGPVPDVSYLYVGDIGGNLADGAQRASITIFRVAEPNVDVSWASSPQTQTFSGVDRFILNYPEGLHDAETLMVDPITGDVVIATKASGTTRVYKANLNALTPGGEATMKLVAAIGFDVASGGDISPDGSQIAIRNEFRAVLWTRCAGQSLGDALDPEPVTLPLLAEANGESLTFLADRSGYVTTSEGAGAAINFFAATCPAPPELVVPFEDRSAFAGAAVRLQAAASGYPRPTYRWTLNGEPLDHTESSLFIPSVFAANAGMYEVEIANASGTLRVAAQLTVRPKPDLRITEIMPNPSNVAGAADWWELTNFDTEPINLAGWRFNDSSGGLADPFVFPAITIAPKESIVFVEGLSAAQFQNWWGIANFQVVTYSGQGLGLSANADAVNLWNATTTDPADTIAFANYNGTQQGSSIIHDPTTGLFGARAELGRHGVVRAATSTDLGSPGRIQGPPAAPELTITRIADGRIRITFAAEANRVYSLDSSMTVDGTFASTGRTFSSPTAGTGSFEVNSTGDAMFFRVRVAP